MNVFELGKTLDKKPVKVKKKADETFVYNPSQHGEFFRSQGLENFSPHVEFGGKMWQVTGFLIARMPEFWYEEGIIVLKTTFEDRQMKFYGKFYFGDLKVRKWHRVIE